DESASRRWCSDFTGTRAGFRRRERSHRTLRLATFRTFSWRTSSPAAAGAVWAAPLWRTLRDRAASRRRDVVVRQSWTGDDQYADSLQLSSGDQRDYAPSGAGRLNEQLSEPARDTVGQVATISPP